MYKIPHEYNVNKLTKSILTQVCYTKSTISIYFGILGYITIWGNLTISFKNNLSFYNELYPIKNDLNLLNFLECEVTNITINNDRDTLKLYFDEIGFLEIMGDEFYETFSINIDNDEILI